MTLLIVVSDGGAEEGLIDSARGLAAAASWDVRAVHVHETGGGAGVGDPEGLELIDVAADSPEDLVKLVSRADVDCLAVGLGAVDGPGLGAVAEAFLECFSAPLLLVRPGMRALSGLQRLIVPLEGTPSSSAAMLFAEATLCRPGREIMVLNVVTGHTPAETGSLPAPRFIDQEQYEWSDWQEEFSMRFSQCASGRTHRVSVRIGDPVGAITREALACEAELIVLSWSGTFAEGHGRVVRRLLEAAPCPLLIVPADAVSGPGD